MQSLDDHVKEAVSSLKVLDKSGQSILQPSIRDHLNQLGFEVDVEDTGLFLRPGLSVWRSKDTREIEGTAGRRKIDLVVRQNGKVVGLIETESDLNDLRRVGVTRRNGHYDPGLFTEACSAFGFLGVRGPGRPLSGALSRIW